MDQANELTSWFLVQNFALDLYLLYRSIPKHSIGYCGAKTHPVGLNDAISSQSIALSWNCANKQHTVVVWLADWVLWCSRFCLQRVHQFLETTNDIVSIQYLICVKVLKFYIKVLIYQAFCLDVAQGRMNGAPNENRTHSCRFASLPC